MIKATAQWTPRNNLGQFVSSKVSPAVTASVQAACDAIEQSAKGYCAVRTGALRDSITTTISQGDSSCRGTVGPTMPYADYVEYGTGRRGSPAPYPHNPDWPGMVAQPYMRPAIDENRGGLIDLFRNQMAAYLGI